MSSNTKIVVLRSKELVYALVLLVVSVLIIMVAVSLFMPSEKMESTESAPTRSTDEDSSEETSDPDTVGMLDSYVPGIYSSTLMLGSANLELQIAVDRNHINSITLSNIDESIATLYPLVSPTLSELSSTIIAEQSIENISFGDENRYTSMLLMQTIAATLDKARASENADIPESSPIY